MKFVIDIDDTILFSEKINGEYKLINYDSDMVKKINELFEHGHEIIIFTGRHWNHLQITIEQLNTIGVKWHTVICGKPVADYYIDDKGLRPNEFLGR